MKSLTSLPKSMRAVYAEDGRGGVSIKTVDVPEPAKGEVLVRMAAAPVNPSDLALITNLSGRNRDYPLPAGREGSGIVVAAGGGLLAKRLLGKRVAVAGEGGAWADFVRVKAVQCLPLPRAVSTEQGAMALINPVTALALLDLARTGRHKAVVSTAAAGQLGRMIHRLFEKNGIPVLHIVRREEQAVLLRSSGVKRVLVSAEANFEKDLKSIAHEIDATLFLDAIGGQLTGQLIEAAPNGSTVLIYGFLSGEDVNFHPGRLINDRVQIEGFFLGSWYRHTPLLKTLRLTRKALKLVGGVLKSEIGHKFLMAEAVAGVDYARAHANEGKALLVIDPEAVDLDT
ncbi:MAG TPA: zinc-binding dehydrogenase [Anaerolineales bacterium]|nr:zinc-binding dehydrogenase [Anaerolineales bacterium]